MEEKLRKSGIDIIGDVPWGTHICQFYETKEDLTEILVPYFKAGLENNEFCLWVTSQPLEIEDAKEALRKAVPDLDFYLEKEQIEVISYTDWFVTEGVFDSEKILNGWVEKLNHAFNSNHDGLRLSGNTSWLENKDWNNFIEYKEQTDNVIGNYRMIALCTYSLNRCKVTEVIDVVVNHQFALIKKEGKWERIESSKRKKAEEAAIQATKNWEYTFDAVPDPIAILDNKYRVVRVNRAMAARLGVTPEDCVGAICYRVIHGTDKPPSSCPHRQLLKDKLEHIKEVREDNLGGDFIVSVSPLFNSEGKITGCIHVARDINERKQAEEALKKAHSSLEERVEERTMQLKKAYKLLKESEESLAEAQRIAHVGNGDWNLVTGEIRWSDELYRIFGLDPQESDVIYDKLLNYVHPEDRDYVNKAFQRGSKGAPISIDYRIILDNGEERTVYTQTEVIFDEKNIPVRIKGTVQDITERKEADEKIKTLANAVESSNDAIVTESLEGIITSWNKGAEQIYGYSAEEILGKNVSILEPDNIKGEIKQLIEKVKQGEKTQHYETSRLKKDGTLINVSITLSPVFDASGELVAISAIARDITERKKAEKALVNLEIARKKEIHHRIKNNLQVISSLLDLQAENFSNRKWIKDSDVINAFRESQDRVMSIALIHEELHEGRGNDALNFSPYLETLVKNLFQTYNLGNTNVSLNMDLEENIFFDMDTAVPLGIIINELVSNSLKYAFIGGGRGKIQINLYRQEDTKGKSTRYNLIVSDDGVGIPEKIDFENSDTLGLQLVDILVAQLDGTIELKRDKGTEFCIKFSTAEKL